MIPALVAATATGFVLSGTYYALMPDAGGADRPVHDRANPPTGALIAVELTRSAAVAALVAGLVSVADWTTAAEGALLGLCLCTLPVVLLVGSVFHEGTAVRTALVHGGDWVLKLVAIGLVTGWLS